METKTVFDHTSSCACVPEGQTVQALPVARTHRLQVASSAIHIMGAKLGTAAVTKVKNDETVLAFPLLARMHLMLAPIRLVRMHRCAGLLNSAQSRLSPSLAQVRRRPFHFWCSMPLPHHLRARFAGDQRRSLQVRFACPRDRSRSIVAAHSLSRRAIAAASSSQRG